MKALRELVAAAAAGLMFVSVLAPEAVAQQRGPARVHGATLGPLAHRASETGGELERMKATGLNTVSLTVWWKANEGESTIAPADYTEPESALAAAVRSAHAAGMAVALMPMFHCQPCASTWRGLIKPVDRDAFYEDYTGFIERYAAFAEQEGVELFFLGSELTTLQGDTSDWRSIAAAARSHYGGEIVYDVNWDAAGGVHFWDAVDVPSISAYFPLTETARPTVEELKAAWRSGKQKLTMGTDSYATVEDLARRTGKQVLFGEAGYRSREYAARQPFDALARNGEPSGEVQANAYQALLEMFDSKSWWRGVIWWDWEIAPVDDTSFSPRGKAAERLLKAWLVDGFRPSAATPARRTTATTARPPSSTSATPSTSTPPSSAVTPSSVATTEMSATTSQRRAMEQVDQEREVAATPRLEATSASSTVPVVAMGAALLLLSVAALGRYCVRRRGRQDRDRTR